MKLYLMRHCLADDGARDDPKRGLDNMGEAQAQLMKRLIKAAGINPDLVLCSDFARAIETAKIVNRGVEIKDLRALRPDATVAAAWASILELAGDADAVLVVTHGPLIQPLLASVAFEFQDRFEWEHGAIAYVNTHRGRFRWFVTPKLAAHLLGEDPSEVENTEAYGRECLNLSENLMRAHKAALVDPLVEVMKRALTNRWKRQRSRLLKTLPDHSDAIAAGDVAHVTAMLQAALPLSDPAFVKVYRAARARAYAGGIDHVHAQLGSPLAEAASKKKLALPATIAPADDAEDYERDIDNTTGDRLQTTLADLSPLTTAAIVAQVRSMFSDFSNPAAGEVSRAETAALNVISDAYHDGGAAIAGYVADSTGFDIEKHWDAEDDACEICLENEADDWIPEDAPHSSGDFEPQAHPNCRCSESYRAVGADTE